MTGHRTNVRCPRRPRPRRLRLDPVLALAILVAAVGAGLACGWGTALLTDYSNINYLPHRIEADRSAATAPQQEEAGTGVGYNPLQGGLVQGAGAWNDLAGNPASRWGSPPHGTSLPEPSWQTAMVAFDRPRR